MLDVVEECVETQVPFKELWDLYLDSLKVIEAPVGAYFNNLDMNKLTVESLNFTQERCFCVDFPHFRRYQLSRSTI